MRHGMPICLCCTRLFLATLLVVGMLATVQAMAQAVEGKVLFYNIANTDFNPYSSDPTTAEQAWMREHYYRQQTYASYFDSRLAWYPLAWVYKDSYAIKPSWDVYRDHPEWVLHDANGNELYIPWSCSGGTCPQFAGDFGNPEFRANWIAEARKLVVDVGYAGLWIDDVNLTWRVGNGDGDTVRPIDPRTGEEMTLSDWRRYFAEFMEEIRAAFPNIEIAHNGIWYAGDTANPFIRRQIDAADWYNLERGATDKGLKGGTSTFGFETFLSFIDFVQSRGRSVILMDYGDTQTEREYGLAAWFLISRGNDMISSNKLEWTAPDSWWDGYGLDLGRALGPRQKWQGLLRRDFACGTVLLNQPDSPTLNVTLESGLTDLNGNVRNAITLAESEAVILTKTCATDGNPTPKPPINLNVT